MKLSESDQQALRDAPDLALRFVDAKSLAARFNRLGRALTAPLTALDWFRGNDPCPGRPVSVGHALNIFDDENILPARLPLLHEHNKAQGTTVWQGRLAHDFNWLMHETMVLSGGPVNRIPLTKPVTAAMEQLLAARPDFDDSLRRTGNGLWRIYRMHHDVAEAQGAGRLIPADPDAPVRPQSFLAAQLAERTHAYGALKDDCTAAMHDTRLMALLSEELARGYSVLAAHQTLVRTQGTPELRS